jgi:hypothetical protein
MQSSYAKQLQGREAGLPPLSIINSQVFGVAAGVGAGGFRNFFSSTAGLSLISVNVRVEL